MKYLHNSTLKVLLWLITNNPTSNKRVFSGFPLKYVGLTEYNEVLTDIKNNQRWFENVFLFKKENPPDLNYRDSLAKQLTIVHKIGKNLVAEYLLNTSKTEYEFYDFINNTLPFVEKIKRFYTLFFSNKDIKPVIRFLNAYTKNYTSKKLMSLKNDYSTESNMKKVIPFLTSYINKYESKIININFSELINLTDDKERFRPLETLLDMEKQKAIKVDLFYFLETETHTSELSDIRIRLKILKKFYTISMTKKADKKTGNIFESTDDYRIINFNGHEFVLSPQQANIIQILHGRYPSWIQGAKLLEEVGSNSKRLIDSFKTNKDIYKTLILKGKHSLRGFYRLNIVK